MKCAKNACICNFSNLSWRKEYVPYYKTELDFIVKVTTNRKQNDDCSEKNKYSSVIYYIILRPNYLHCEIRLTINLTIDRTMHFCCIHTHPIDFAISLVVYNKSQRLWLLACLQTISFCLKLQLFVLNEILRVEKCMLLFESITLIV